MDYDEGEMCPDAVHVALVEDRAETLRSDEGAAAGMSITATQGLLTMGRRNADNFCKLVVCFSKGLKMSNVFSRK